MIKKMKRIQLIPMKRIPNPNKATPIILDKVDAYLTATSNYPPYLTPKNVYPISIEPNSSSTITNIFGMVGTSTLSTTSNQQQKRSEA